jgi:FixJ family two-component response regulator
MPATPRPVVGIVDDDPSVRRALVRLVASMGLRVRSFASPAEILEAGGTDGLDCLLLDVRLPGMDGFDLYRRLCDRRRLPVIFVTAHDDAAAARRAAAAGAVALLPKPFDDGRLLDALLEATAARPAPPRGGPQRRPPAEPEAG